MDSSSDEQEYGPEHVPTFQRVMDMFEGKPDFQRLVRLGILANMAYDVEYDGAGGCDRWVPRLRSASPPPFPGCDGAETAGAGASKEEEKAEKKRLKRQRRKERKRCEKEEQNGQEGEQEAETEKPDVKDPAAASEDEELDMTSSFVSKARSKLEQKPKPEREKRPPAEKKPAPPRSPSVEENIQKSSQLANLGNRYASSGDFKKAVLLYTDAIKYNPREHKLFGNRSFCFERMRLYMKALDDAELSLGMCPGWDKGLFRKGKALAGLKRYEEAERAFGQVLEADGSRADAADELRRVQLAHLSEYGYTLEQSRRALDAHRSVQAALYFLSGATRQPAPSSKARHAAETAAPPQKELYPVWVGNLLGSVSEGELEQLFSRVGPVDSVRLLTYKRCAFVNFTSGKDGAEAIRRFNGFEMNGTKLAVRYPDRIAPGMGISRAALSATGGP